MKKIILFTLLLLVLSLVLPIAATADIQAGNSARLLTAANIQPVNSDMRVVALQNVLRRHNSPLVDQAASFVKYADLYGVDWKLLPAISGVESSYGIELLSYTYNAYGWGSGLIPFKNWDNGIEIINKALRENYINRLGTDDVYSIGHMYAESPTWAIRVDRNTREFAAEYVKLTSQTLTLSI